MKAITVALALALTATAAPILIDGDAVDVNGTKHHQYRYAGDLQAALRELVLDLAAKARLLALLDAARA